MKNKQPVNAKYKIHLDPTSDVLTQVDFLTLCSVKGIKTLRKSSDTFSHRARIDRPKIFRGSDLAFEAKRGDITPTLQTYTEQNNIQAYCKAWAYNNNLKA